MRILKLSILLAVLLGAISPAAAWWQSIQQVAIAPPPSYQGPGDVVAGAKGWWGLRCYNAAYAGNVADVYAPSDASHTLITCSAGGTLNETLQALATTCAVSCTVKTLYDQSGNGHDAVNAAPTLRPALVLSCLGSKYCMAFVKATSQSLIATAVGATNQPWTFSSVANRTGSTTSFQGSVSDQVGGFGLQFGNAVNTILTYAGGTGASESGIADNAWHAIQSIGNGVSSVIDGDGTATTGNSNSGSLGANIVVGAGLATLDGRMTEAGLWGSGFTSGNRSAMCHNQFTYWGTSTSC
jgi:hypothetical protein